ncbi:MAG: hypothetical protein LBR07_04120, partial [Puniceicoccales bacterium]|nr:hypothetical protein [Puniceicoccales bacterium]
MLATSTTETYVRFINANAKAQLEANSGALLANIAFTGYSAGAKIEQGADGYYYLLPTGVLTYEWVGTGTAADDGGPHTGSGWTGPYSGVKWSTPAPTNWLYTTNTFPNAVGASVAIRDLDKDLDGKAILVDGAFTIGAFESMSASHYTLAADSTVAGAKLILQAAGAGDATISVTLTPMTFSVPLELVSDTEFKTNVARGVGAVVLASPLSGTGDFTLKTDIANAFLDLRSESAAFAGDFRWEDPVAIRLTGAAGTAASPAHPFTGTAAGRLYIGDTASVAETFRIESTVADRFIALENGWTLAANLLLANTSSASLDNIDAHNLSIAGALTLAGAANGQRTITVEQATATQDPSATNSHRLTINGPVDDGAGAVQTGIYKNGLGVLELKGTGTFRGDFTFRQGHLVIGADNALGTGTFVISGYLTTDDRTIIYSNSSLTVSTPSGVVRLDNRLSIPGATPPALDATPNAYENRFGYVSGVFYMNANSAVVGASVLAGGTFYAASGASAFIFGKNHVITGTGGIARDWGNDQSLGNGSAGLTAIFLNGASTFSGGSNAKNVFGASSTASNAALLNQAFDDYTPSTVVSGPAGTGFIGPLMGVYSDNPAQTWQRVGNEVLMEMNSDGNYRLDAFNPATVLAGATAAAGAGATAANASFAAVTGSPTVNYATTLILSAPTFTVGRWTGTGNTDHANAKFAIAAGLTLRIDSRMLDSPEVTAAGAKQIITTSYGTLWLTNDANQLSDGIIAQLGTVRVDAEDNGLTKTISAFADADPNNMARPLGNSTAAGALLTRANNTGAALAAGAYSGTFLFTAADGAVITLTPAGAARFALEQRGGLRVSRRDTSLAATDATAVTLLLADGVNLSSTAFSNAVNDAGFIAGDIVATAAGTSGARTANTLGVKVEAQKFVLGAFNTTTLNRDYLIDNLTAATGADSGRHDSGVVTLNDGSVLDLAGHPQRFAEIAVVAGGASATINVAATAHGYTATNPLYVDIGNITGTGSGASDSNLTFLNWEGDPITGLGATRLRVSTQTVNRVFYGVTLQPLVGEPTSHSSIVLRNSTGELVLMPFQNSYLWDGWQDGTPTANQWESYNWNKDGEHSNVPPNNPREMAVFDTDFIASAKVAGGGGYATGGGGQLPETINVAYTAGVTVGTLIFTGSRRDDLTLTGNGIYLDNTTTSKDGVVQVTKEGPSNVTIENLVQLFGASNSSKLINVDGITGGDRAENLLIVQDGTGDLFFKGQIMGMSSRLILNGSGTGRVIFTNDGNTFAQLVLDTGATLVIGADYAGGGGAIGTPGGTLYLRSGALLGATVTSATSADGAGNTFITNTATDTARVLTQEYVFYREAADVAASTIHGDLTEEIVAPVVKVTGSQPLTLAGNGEVAGDAQVEVGTGSTLNLGAIGGGGGVAQGLAGGKISDGSVTDGNTLTLSGGRGAGAASGSGGVINLYALPDNNTAGGRAGHLKIEAVEGATLNLARSVGTDGTAASASNPITYKNDFGTATGGVINVNFSNSTFTGVLTNNATFNVVAGGAGGIATGTGGFAVDGTGTFNIAAGVTFKLDRPDGDPADVPAGTNPRGDFAFDNALAGAGTLDIALKLPAPVGTEPWRAFTTDAARLTFTNTTAGAFAGETIVRAGALEWDTGAARTLRGSALTIGDGTWNTQTPAATKDAWRSVLPSAALVISETNAAADKLGSLTLDGALVEVTYATPYKFLRAQSVTVGAAGAVISLIGFTNDLPFLLTTTPSNSTSAIIPVVYSDTPVDVSRVQSARKFEIFYMAPGATAANAVGAMDLNDGVLNKNGAQNGIFVSTGLQSLNAYFGERMPIDTAAAVRAGDANSYSEETSAPTLPTEDAPLYLNIHIGEEESSHPTTKTVSTGFLSQHGSVEFTGSRLIKLWSTTHNTYLGETVIAAGARLDNGIIYAPDALHAGNPAYPNATEQYYDGSTVVSARTANTFIQSSAIEVNGRLDIARAQQLNNLRGAATGDIVFHPELGGFLTLHNTLLTGRGGYDPTNTAEWTTSFAPTWSTAPVAVVVHRVSNPTVYYGRIDPPYVVKTGDGV